MPARMNMAIDNPIVIRQRPSAGDFFGWEFGYGRSSGKDNLGQKNEEQK